MRAAWTIARKDLRELRRDSRLVLVGGVVALVLVLAAAGGVERTARDAAERAVAQQAERDRWLDQGEVNPHAAAHYGTFVFAPVEPLRLVDPGISSHVPAAVFLEAHRQQVSRYRPVDDAVAVRGLSDVSVASCLQTVIPLFVVLLTATAVAREREGGTWPLLRVAGAGARSVVMGKGLAVAAALSVVVGPAVTVAVTGTRGAAALPFDRDEAARAGLMVAAYAVYLATWLASTLAVSMRIASTSRALASSVGLWLAACVVAPPALMTIATVTAPAPSVAAFTAAIDDDRAARPSWDDRVAAATERFLNGEELPAASNPEVVALIDTEASDTEIYGRHLAVLSTRLEAQERLYRRLAWLTPATAMHVTSMTLAGTDYAHHRHFALAAADYRTTLLRSLNDDLAAFDSWKTFNAAGSRDLWARIPDFDYVPPTVGWAMQLLAAPLAGLLVWGGVAMLILGRNPAHRDVR